MSEIEFPDQRGLRLAASGNEIKLHGEISATGKDVMVHRSWDAYDFCCGIDEWQDDKGKSHFWMNQLMGYDHVYLHLPEDFTDTEEMIEKFGEACEPLWGKNVMIANIAHVESISIWKWFGRCASVSSLVPTDELPIGWDLSKNIPMVNDPAKRDLVKLSWARFESQFLVRGYFATHHKVKGAAKKFKHVPTPLALRTFLYVTELEEFIEVRRPWIRRRAQTIDTDLAFCLEFGSSLKTALTGAEGCKSVRLPGYRPGGEFMYTDGSGLARVNRYRPSTLHPVRGDIDPFQEFLKSFNLPPEDRRALMFWMMWVIRGVKPNWAVAFTSVTEGIGKTTLAEFMSYLLGPWNVRFTDAQTLTGDRKTVLIDTQLLVINELYSSSSYGFTNAAKTIITDPTVQVRPMFKEEYQQENHSSLMVFSNSPNLMKLRKDDRRWLVLDADSPNRLSPAEFKKLRKWFYKGGGAEAMLHFFQTCPTDYYAEWRDLNIEHDAPKSAARENLIQSSVNNLTSWLIDEGFDECDMVVIQDLGEYARMKSYQGKTSPAAIKLALEEMGFIPKPGSNNGRWQMKVVMPKQLQFHLWSKPDVVEIDVDVVRHMRDSGQLRLGSNKWRKMFGLTKDLEGNDMLMDVM